MNKYNQKEQSKISEDTPDHMDEECYVIEYPRKKQEFDESLYDHNHVENFDGNLYCNR